MSELRPDLGSREKGDWGEDLAVSHLLALGWTLVKRGYKGRHGEIDIIALDGDELVFVEVKLRLSGFQAEGAVDQVKQERIRLTASEYLAKVGFDAQKVRFDVIALQGQKINHLRDAFR